MDEDYRVKRGQTPFFDTLLQVVELGLEPTTLDSKFCAPCGVGHSCPLKEDCLHLAREGVCLDPRLGWPLGMGVPFCSGPGGSDALGEGQGRHRLRKQMGPVPGPLWERTLSFFSLSLATRG